SACVSPASASVVTPRLVLQDGSATDSATTEATILRRVDGCTDRSVAPHGARRSDFDPRARVSGRLGHGRPKLRNFARNRAPLIAPCAAKAKLPGARLPHRAYVPRRFRLERERAPGIHVEEPLRGRSRRPVPRGGDDVAREARREAAI